MSVNEYLRTKDRRESLLDPASGLYRTHVFAAGAGPAISNFTDLGEPCTFALDFAITGTAPNGCLWEIGKADHGVILWLDNVLGELGFAAGRGTGVAPNDGVSGVTKLNHLSATAAVVAGGGTGYSVNDLITLTGGTFGRATVLRVLTLSGSAVATVSIEDGGEYSVAPGNPVAQGSVDPAGGSGATFTMTYSLARTSMIRTVAAVIPCDGSIRLWVDGKLRVQAQSASGSFDTGTPANSVWAAGPGAGEIGNIAGTANDRAPAASRVAITNTDIIGDDMSIYDKQRPQHFYNPGKLY